VYPLREILKQDYFSWTAEVFQCVKDAIANSPVLALFDPKLPVIVSTDASGYGVGATMTQIQNGTEVLVACAPGPFQQPSAHTVWVKERLLPVCGPSRNGIFFYGGVGSNFILITKLW
jgi:hypothetical protein